MGHPVRPELSPHEFSHSQRLLLAVQPLALAAHVLLQRGVVLLEPREVRATTVRSSCHDSFFFSFVLRPSGLSHHGVVERLE